MIVNITVHFIDFNFSCFYSIYILLVTVLFNIVINGYYVHIVWSQTTLHYNVYSQNNDTAYIIYMYNII